MDIILCMHACRRARARHCKNKMVSLTNLTLPELHSYNCMNATQVTYCMNATNIA